jgi:hypothetical protein
MLNEEPGWERPPGSFYFSMYALSKTYGGLKSQDSVHHIRVDIEAKRHLGG